MVLNRREFAKSSLAALGFLALPGTPVFAAPAGWKPDRKPNLAFGVLADTHLMVEWDGKSLYRTMTFNYVRNAFKLFKRRNIDAFVHLGDAAHRGAVREWEFHKELFREVFGKRNAPETIVIVGNHEYFGNDARIKKIWPDPDKWKENAICADVARHYERVWGAPYKEFFHKEVKGYHFFGRHWTDAEYDGTREGPFSEYILSKAGECALDGAKPFFILSHRRHHFRFCKSLKDYHNAIAFMGHWHQSNADWKTIYCDRDSFGGFFPHMEVGACRVDGHNGMYRPLETVQPEDSGSFKGSYLPSRQAMIVNVYDSMVVFERHEVGLGGKLGPDWVLPLGEYNPHPFSQEELKKTIGEPQFGRNAKLAVKRISSAPPRIQVRIPLADGNPGSRVFAYEVAVTGDDPDARLCKSAYSKGCNVAPGREPNHGITEVDIPVAELPAGKKLAIAVRPFSSLGTAGHPISTVYRA